MIFRRRPKNAPAPEVEETSEAEETTPEESDPRESDAEVSDADESGEGELDIETLDSLDWRGAGPWDITEIDLDLEPLPGRARIDLGSMIITGFGGAELRLQVAEETQQIISAMLIHGDSALELGAYAAPRSGGLWPELREEIIEAATEAGGSAALVEGPFGVELRRILPVTTPDGEQGYQPSRMWVVEGPRWLLRGILYGQAAVLEGLEPPVSDLLTAFREVVVRRGDEAKAPGDLLPLSIPADVDPAGNQTPH
ncbi:hypothetical protein MLP_22550 [Microlunatus phosphovorus NM-1]|uniref:DUF3710 domain-containing protein n=1 Tax=Microlunatus phosphovorus (strain ATCC 700054 / DSM 10555 / JCM 9379 / NBRC 101784 / NCIMB 13414 / VKM Ac-1990 / NM-1) TaxID=1032480 RepID=F5XEQ3_MICPN|nr:DUF3710 domain-containing protein [Microlunatus phosphovorus]BAK35269.1 hypothetical protein MLP_22550 [Microlunatus phosphovorus NM-1]